MATLAEMARRDGMFCAMFDHKPTPDPSAGYRQHFHIGWNLQKELEAMQKPPRICSWCGGRFRTAVAIGLCPRCEGRFKAEHDGAMDAIIANEDAQALSQIQDEARREEE